jgi:hypothetical protein
MLLKLQSEAVVRVFIIARMIRFSSNLGFPERIFYFIIVSSFECLSDQISRGLCSASSCRIRKLSIHRRYAARMLGDLSFATQQSQLQIRRARMSLRQWRRVERSAVQ